MTIGTLIYRRKPTNRTVLAAALVLVLVHCQEGLAQGATITNLHDLAQVAFSDSIYIPFSAWDWRAYALNGGEPWWVDCSVLPCVDLLSSSTNFSAYGVRIVPALLTKNVLTGETLMQSQWATDVVARTAAPSGYQPGQLSYQDGMVWRMWLQATNCPDCWDIEGVFPPPIVSLRTFLADMSDYATYESNLEAEAQAEAAESFSMSRTFTAMDDEGSGMMMDDSSDPCMITNDAAPFYVIGITQNTNAWVTATWQSCTDHIYIVQSESSLTPTSSYRDVAWMFGSDQQTSWTDTNAVGRTQYFYRVIRANPNTLNYGIPYWWAVENGFDPLDPNLDLKKPTGDGYTLLEDYVNGTSPDVSNTAPTFIINNGNPYTATLNISVQATSTNYPKIRVWLDTLLTNVTLFANTGTMVTYTLPDEGDGVYGVYAQYANTDGTPASQQFGQSVTLDRAPPVIAITAPASNAVLNQAFMTLAATVYDPIGTQPNMAAPLSIWINGQPFWDRAGTNLVVERFPVPAGTNAFTVTIQAVNQAGLTNTASQTWSVNTSTATNAPTLLSVNLSSEMQLPNVNSIWVEGTVDNDYALISAIVSAASGDVMTNSLTVGQNQYKGMVPLESGTNRLVLVASDAAGNTSSNLFTVISSTEFSAAITNLVFGAFATVPSNTVSGYVSALYDAGLPTQTNVTSVVINGVAAVLGTNIDAYGNISFTTTNKILLGVPITGTVGGPGIPTDPPSLPPMMAQTYEVTAKETVSDSISEGETGDPFNLSWSTVSNCWQGTLHRGLLTFDYAVTNNGAQEYGTNLQELPMPVCQTLLNPDQINWQGSSNTFSLTLSGPINRSLSLGVNGYIHGAGEQFAVVVANLDPTNNTCMFQDQNAALRALQRQKNSGWVRFQAASQLGTNTTVLTFQGVDYARANGAPRDLSQLQFRSQSPIAYSNAAQTVSYLLTVKGGQQDTINQDDFTRLSASTARNYAFLSANTTDACPIVKSFSHVGDYLSDYQWVSWTGFTNHSPVHILWTNGVDITGTSGNSIIVGQQVNLTATVDTPGIATSNFTWSVSGSAISNYVVSVFSGQSLPLTQTNSASINFYWIKGGQQNVTVSVLLTNGSVATSQASFSVARPMAQIAFAKGTVGADSSYYLGTYLHYGTADNEATACEPGLNGMVLTYSAGTLTGFTGTYGWFHLNSSFLQYTNSAGVSKQCLPYGYDGALPFGSDCFYDLPGLGLSGRIEAIDAESHQTFLMFQSSSTNSIWVPLKEVDWNWSGNAVLTNGTWLLVSSTNPDPTITDTSTPPTWTTNWQAGLESCTLSNGF